MSSMESILLDRVMFPFVINRKDVHFLSILCISQIDEYELPKYKFGVIEKNNDNEGVRTSGEMNAKREELKSQEPKKHRQFRK